MKTSSRGHGRIRLVLTDCDGVLTDGAVWTSEGGEEWKRFCVRDGMGVERLRAEAGIETGIVTREQGGPVVARARKLGIGELHLGVLDKRAVLAAVGVRKGIDPSAIAFIGDDVNDLGAMAAAGLAACPSDALAPVRGIAHYVCGWPGGGGAFRELAELVLDAQRNGLES